MRVVSGILAKLRHIVSLHALLFLIRAAAVLSMSFAAAFGFGQQLGQLRSPHLCHRRRRAVRRRLRRRRADGLPQPPASR